MNPVSVCIPRERQLEPCPPLTAPFWWKRAHLHPWLQKERHSPPQRWNSRSVPRRRSKTGAVLLPRRPPPNQLRLDEGHQAKSPPWSQLCNQTGPRRPWTRNPPSLAQIQKFNPVSPMMLTRHQMAPRITSTTPPPQDRLWSTPSGSRPAAAASPSHERARGPTPPASHADTGGPKACAVSRPPSRRGPSASGSPRRPRCRGCST